MFKTGFNSISKYAIGCFLSAGVFIVTPATAQTFSMTATESDQTFSMTASGSSGSYRSLIGFGLHERICVSADGVHAYKIKVPRLSLAGAKRACHEGLVANENFIDPVNGEQYDSDALTSFRSDADNRYMTCQGFRVNYTKWDRWNPCDEMEQATFRLNCGSTLGPCGFEVKPRLTPGQTYLVSEIALDTQEIQHVKQADGTPEPLATGASIEADFGETGVFGYNSDASFAVRSTLVDIASGALSINTDAAQVAVLEVSKVLFGGAISAEPSEEHVSTSFSTEFHFDAGEAPGLIVSKDAYNARQTLRDPLTVLKYVKARVFGAAYREQQKEVKSRNQFCSPNQRYRVSSDIRIITGETEFETVISGTTYGDVKSRFDQYMSSESNREIPSNNSGYFFCGLKMFIQNSETWRDGQKPLTWILQKQHNNSESYLIRRMERRDVLLNSGRTRLSGDRGGAGGAPWRPGR